MEKIDLKYPVGGRLAQGYPQASKGFANKIFLTVNSNEAIYEAGDGVKRKIATPYLNRQIGGKDGDNKNSHCSLNELEKT